MPAVDIRPSDLDLFADIPEARAAAMIEDAMATAGMVAPCIHDVDFEHYAAAKAIIRGAILRWHEAGAGGVTQQQQTSGSFSQSTSIDTRTERRGMFWPSEIEQLQALCVSSTRGTARTMWLV